MEQVRFQFLCSITWTLWAPLREFTCGKKSRCSLRVVVDPDPEKVDPTPAECEKKLQKNIKKTETSAEAVLTSREISDPPKKAKKQPKKAQNIAYRSIWEPTSAETLRTKHFGALQVHALHINRRLTDFFYALI